MRAAIGMTCLVLILVLGAGAALGGRVDSAQPRPGGEPGGRMPPGRQGGQPPALPDSARIAQMMDEMAAELSLTDEQKAQITELHVAHFDEVRDRLAEGRPDRSEMEALRKELENDVKAVLHEDQLAAYARCLESRRPHGPGDGRRR